MQWQQLLRPYRQGLPQPASAEAGRSPFEKDHDKVVFSPSFRRLDSKTQVHPLPTNDNVHTRLIHSMEVGCVGRSLGTSVGRRLGAKLPDGISAQDIGMIVQAACLAHDIGNPPFGHAGEQIIRDWFRTGRGAEYLNGLDRALSADERTDLENYEGNAQGFRVLTQLEYRPFAGGMRLTYPVLATFLKYPWTSPHAEANGGKFGCNQTEHRLLQDVGRRLSVPQRGDGIWARYPLVYLMEAADDVCYALMDIEDGFEMGILHFEEAEALFQQVIDTPLDYEADTRQSPATMLARARGRAMDLLINTLTETFMAHQDSILAGEFEGTLLEACDPRLARAIENAKQVARERIFNSPDKKELEIGAGSVLGTLLDRLVKALLEQKSGHRLTFESRNLLQLMGSYAPPAGESHYKGLMRILDYIGGMTDNYAMRLAKRIRGI